MSDPKEGGGRPPVFSIDNPPIVTKWPTKEFEAKVNVGTAAAPVYEKRKRKVIMFDPADGAHKPEHSDERLLRCVAEFEKACEPEYLNYSTGPKKFSHFAECLSGVALDKYENLITNMAQTNNQFAIMINEFVGKFLRKSAKTDQMRYLSTFKKPKSLTTTMDFSLTEACINLMKYYPGCNGVVPYNEQGIKEICFNHCEEAKYLAVSSHLDIYDQNVTLDDIKDKFETEDAKDKLNNDYTQHKRKRDRRMEDQTNRFEKKKNKRFKQKSKKGGNCWYHPGHHDWIDCYGNEKGPNYRSDYVTRSPNGRNPRMARKRTKMHICASTLKRIMSMTRSR